MEGLNFRGYRVTEMYYRNDAPIDKEIDLNITFGTKLISGKKKGQCECLYKVDIADSKKEIPFEVRIKILGRFNYDLEADKKEIHAAAANELFPFIRAILIGITSHAGVSPIPLPNRHVTKDDIKDDG